MRDDLNDWLARRAKKRRASKSPGSELGGPAPFSGGRRPLARTGVAFLPVWPCAPIPRRLTERRACGLPILRPLGVSWAINLGCPESENMEASNKWLMVGSTNTCTDYRDYQNDVFFSNSQMGLKTLL